VEAATGYQARQAPLRSWAFLTHHAQVLLAVARDPVMSVNEIAENIGITERYTYRLLSDLQQAGYIQRRRNGRRNHYELRPELELGDPLIGGRPLWQLLELGDSRPRPQTRWRRHQGLMT
jgi:DNA-binding IclR family transcriptional regulator